MVETPISFGLSCVAYSRFYDGPGKVEESTVLSCLGAILSVWAVALVAFMFSVKRSHWHTFVSLETGSQFVQRTFREAAGNDERRVDIFTNHVSLWRSIVPEVRNWVRKNYGGWAGQAWYTEAVKVTIPVDMLPPVDITLPIVNTASAFATLHMGQLMIFPVAGRTAIQTTVTAVQPVVDMQQHMLPPVCTPVDITLPDVNIAIEV
jgi:hypothetical protein